MALAPVIAWGWLRLAGRGREPSTTVKFALGLFLVGLSFFVFVVPMAMASGGTKVSPMWLVAVYLVQTVGELCLSPVGLSVTTKMAPAKYGSQMMGVWFLAVTAGDCTTSLLSLAGVDLNGTGMVTLEAALACFAGYAVWHYRKRIVALMGTCAEPGTERRPLSPARWELPDMRGSREGSHPHRPAHWITVKIVFHARPLAHFATCPRRRGGSAPGPAARPRAGRAAGRPGARAAGRRPHRPARPGRPAAVQPPARHRDGLSRGTVKAAYDQLAAEGYLSARQGSATVVTARSGTPAPAPRSPASARRPRRATTCAPDARM